MDLFSLPFCAWVAWTYMIILCPGCTDLYDCHFVLRPHIPIWSAFCTQIIWTYFACVNSQHRGDFGLWVIFTILHSYHLDLYDCIFAIRLHEPIWLLFCSQVTWTYMISIFHSGHTDLLYLLQLSLQPKLKYYNNLHSGHVDLFCMCELTAQRLWILSYFCHFALRPNGPMWLPFCAQVAQTYNGCHFVLRLHGPIWLAFCTQVTWTHYISYNSTYDLNLNITILPPSAIPTYHSSPQCTHVLSIRCDIDAVWWKKSPRRI